ncbi:hypothetical protein BASA81_006126 [Batrachochytrium salamandrivorans]|nr:hypothetical protein BASA81_006126 [Batrachochytrium salamandrivorans]
MEDREEDDHFSAEVVMSPMGGNIRPMSMGPSAMSTSAKTNSVNRRVSLRGKLSSMKDNVRPMSTDRREMLQQLESTDRMSTGGGGGNILGKVQSMMDRRRSSIMTRMGISSSGRFMAGEDGTLAQLGAGGKHRSQGRNKKPMSAEDAAWEERWTVDDLPYFYNIKTEAVTWEKPDALKTEEELELDGEWTWVPHPTMVWQGARVIKRQNNQDVHVKTISHPPKTMVIPASRVLKNADTNNRDMTIPLWPLMKSSLYLLEDDLVALDDPNEGLILHNLRTRFGEDKLYTWVGASRSVLVSVNPYRNLPSLYSEESITAQREKSPNRPPPPHVFGIASDALDSLLYDAQNNSILISGESGSGKTEATKHCLRYLAKVAGTKSHVENRVLEANPILEAFGNAKTIRNNNSSRFGKWIEVFFDSKTRQISGANITTYLLERSRVIYQTKGERNFHIFYNALTSEDFRQQYGLHQPVEYYRYLNNSGTFKVAGVDDGKEMQRIIRSLNEMGFEVEEQEWVFRIVCSLLHLGQIDFVALPQTDGEAVVQLGCKVSEFNRSAKTGRNTDRTPTHNNNANATTTTGELGQESHLVELCRLLEFDPALLQDKLCHRTMSIRGETSVIPLSVEDAQLGVDSFSMTVYSRLFMWLVAKLNQSLGGSGKGHFIGILDIFGFEIFEKNSFEQLCINFANEKLQAQFNASMFEEEEGLYTFEGIDFEKVPFQDNAQVLTLIEDKSTGLLPQLDDEVRGVGGTDERYVSKMTKQHEMSDRFQIDVKKRMESPCAFQILHYAGVVKYDGQGFVQANNDTLYEDLYVLANSSVRLKTLFPMESGHPSAFVPSFPGAQQSSLKSTARSAARGRSETNMDAKAGVAGTATSQGTKKRVNTVSSEFRDELSMLMELLEQTQSRYIRCVKPNASQQPELFESMLVLEQLRYSGVFEAVEIRRKGFPFRWTHRQFVYQYKIITTLLQEEVTFKSREDDYEGLAQEILDLQPGRPKPFRDVKVGRTRVLYRAKEHKLLLLLRNLALEKMIPWLQARLRGYIARNMRKIFRECDEILQDAMDLENDLDALERAFEETEIMIGDIIPDLFPNAKPSKRRAAEKLADELTDWIAIEEQMEDLENDQREVIELFFDMQDCLNRVDQLQHIPMTRRQERLVDNLREKVEQCKSQQSEERIAKMEERAQSALDSLDRSRMKQVLQEVEREAEFADRYFAPVDKIRQVLLDMAELDNKIKLALHVLDRSAMQALLVQVKQYYPTSNSETEDVKTCREKLALNELEFCKLELQVAARDGDEPRRRHREIHLWENELTSTKLEGGDLLHHKQWRAVDEWFAKASFMDRKLRRGKIMGSFKVWTPTPMHYPLTGFGGETADTADRRAQALLMFRHVLTIFGCVVSPVNGVVFDASNPDGSVQTVLLWVLQDPLLRLELVLQVVKMLNTNPDPRSVEKGEEFVGLLLLTVPMEELQPSMFAWTANRFGGRHNKYWQAMITRRYLPEQSKPKNIGELRKEWTALERCPFALKPGQSTGPSAI